MIYLLDEQPSILSSYIRELRDHNIQKDPLRLRENLKRVGFIMGYELSKQLNFKEIDIQTPLGEAQARERSTDLVLATILRAGLPMHQGLLSAFDHAENAFVSAYRKYQDDGTFDIEIEYLSSPLLTNKTVVLCDPMIASGASMELAYRALLKKGTPDKVIVLSVIASQPGMNKLKQVMPANTDYYIGALDAELTAKSYIVPGLGDAGDLAFGQKS
ncbi:MAG: uracil phosphoribosyltransferase [Bacteroidota bacterium]